MCPDQKCPALGMSSTVGTYTSWTECRGMAKPRKPKSGVSSLAPQDIHRYPRIIQDIYMYIYLRIYVLLIYGWILDHWNWCTSRLRNIPWSKSYEHIRDLQTPARSLFTGILSPKLGNSSLFIPKHSPLFCDWAILLFCDTKQKSALDNYDERVDPMYNCGVFLATLVIHHIDIMSTLDE